jgi:hypothetical protein
VEVILSSDLPEDTPVCTLYVYILYIPLLIIPLWQCHLKLSSPAIPSLQTEASFVFPGEHLTGSGSPEFARALNCDGH